MTPEEQKELVIDMFRNSDNTEMIKALSITPSLGGLMYCSPLANNTPEELPIPDLGTPECDALVDKINKMTRADLNEDKIRRATLSDQKNRMIRRASTEEDGS